MQKRTNMSLLSMKRSTLSSLFVRCLQQSLKQQSKSSLRSASITVKHFIRYRCSWVNLMSIVLRLGELISEQGWQVFQRLNNGHKQSDVKLILFLRWIRYKIYWLLWPKSMDLMGSRRMRRHRGSTCSKTDSFLKRSYSSWRIWYALIRDRRN